MPPSRLHANASQFYWPYGVCSHQKLPRSSYGHWGFRMRNIETKDIANRLASRADVVAAYLLPSGKMDGNEWRCGDVSGVPGQSLGIHIAGNKAGVWQDFATGEGGDLLSLWQAVRNCDFPTALHEAAEWLGMSPMLPVQRRSAKPVPVFDKPPGGVDGVSRFTYTDSDKRPVIYVTREERSSGKIIRQCGKSVDGNGWQWNLDHAPKPRPLYRLPGVLAAELVCIHEGEKSVVAATKARLSGCHTTTIGGAGNGRHSDFMPIQGKAVVIIPDNDKPGEKHAQQVAKLATDAGAKSVKILRLPGLPKKGDVVEWLQAEGSTEQWAELIKQAPFFLDEIQQIKASDKQSCEVVPLSNEVRNNKARSKLHLVCMDDIKMEPIHWLWHHFLARGKLHIFAGQAGTGKTTIALDMAATVTKGGRWPDRSQAPKGSALIWSGEDDPADSLKPRLAAMGANMRKVFIVGDVVTDKDVRSFDPATDMEYLLEAAETIPDLSLIVVDPIVSAVSGDSHKNAEVRKSLQPLVDMGLRANAAILGITHFTKGSKGSDPAERVTGSLAFGALARLVMCTVKPAEEEDHPRFIRAKSNISPDGGGFEYSLQRKELADGIEGQHIEWGNALEGTATELMAAIENERGDVSALEEAATLLTELLADGCKPLDEIRKDMKAHSVSDATFKRARKGGDSETRKFGGGRYFIKLPYHPWEHDGKVLEKGKKQSGGSTPACEPPEHISAQECSNTKEKQVDQGVKNQVAQGGHEPSDLTDKTGTVPAWETDPFGDWKPEKAA